MSTIKILCFAILGMIVGSVYSLPPAGPVAGTNILDFDTIANIGDNIPAMFQPKIYEPAGYNVAGPNNLRYVYFTVINNAHGGAPAPVIFHAAQMVVPNPANERNIYFPADGSQPTTPEAVEYSCANVDNRENSPITEWYMKMFGVIPFQNVGAPGPNGYIKAGWSAPNVIGANVNAQRVIMFNFGHFFHNTLHQNLSQLGAEINEYNLAHAPANNIAMPQIGGNALNALTIAQLLLQTQANVQALFNALHLNNNAALERGVQTDQALRVAYFNAMSNLQLLNNMLLQTDNPAETVANLRNVILQNNFVDSFRLIASSSVGRVLLYRLLIEIRRQQAIGNNAGVEANDVMGLNVGINRDMNRSIIVGCDDFAFQQGLTATPGVRQDAYIYFNNTQCALCTIGSSLGGENIIGLQNAHPHIALFHEMTHWYHRLRAPARADFFMATDPIPFRRRSNFLWLIYWRTLQTEGRKQFAESQWSSDNNDFLDQEEVLTILGAPSSANTIIYSPTFHQVDFQGRKCYLEGDDLCENLYRACCGIPLRFGYHTTAFSENGKVIKNVISTIDHNIKPFTHVLGRYRYLD